jgi:hypothetical protein
MQHQYKLKSIVLFEYLKMIPNYEVYLFLKNITNDTSWDVNISLTIENLLFELNDPLVNLALAQYGYDHDVIIKIYENSNHLPLKLAAISNRSKFLGDSSGNSSWMRHDVINHIMNSNSEDEKYAFITNPLIGYGTLRSLLQRENTFGIGFDSLSENNWQKLLSYAGDNELLANQYDSSQDEDGWCQYEFDTMLLQAWRLVDVVPVTKEWASTLWQLLRFVHQHYDINPKKSIERWISIKEDSADIRTVLARLLSNDDLMSLKDDDHIKERILEERSYTFKKEEGTAKTSMEQSDIKSKSTNISYRKDLISELKSIHQLVYWTFFIALTIAIYFLLKKF